MPTPENSSKNSPESDQARSFAEKNGQQENGQQERPEKGSLQEACSHEGRRHEAKGSEKRRLKALRRYDVLGGRSLESLDRITRLAADHFEVPASVVNFIGSGRQWFKSTVGLEELGIEVREMSPEASFCLHVIESEETTVVEDALNDERFEENPFVTGEPVIRFYAGAPLVSPDGYPIGTLCVLDRKPRAPSAKKISRLEDLAQMTMSELELRRKAEEHRQAEKALREERDRLETLFESLPTPVMHGRADEEGRIRIQAINCAFEEVFDMSSSTAEGKDIYDFLVPEEEHEKIENHVCRALEQGALQTEIRRKTPTGPRDFHVQVAVLEEAGMPEGYAIYTDITERKRREERLRRTSARLEALLERSPDMINIHDTEGNLIDPNPRLCEKTGYAKEELMDMKVWDLDQTVSPQEARSVWSRMKIGDREKIEGVYQCKDGSTFPVEVHLRRLGLEGEERFMAISRDITEQVRRERELRKKKRRYEAIFEDPNILVGLLETNGKVLDINQTALEYVDASLEELAGRTFWETPWFTGDEDLQKEIRKWASRAADGEYVEFEADHSKAIGERLVARGIFRPVTNEEGKVTSLLISSRDITGQKEHERKLKEAKEEAERASRLKSAFLANMSHEIRTPLTSIIGFAEAIGDEVEEERKGPIPRFANLIEKSGTRLLETLNSVLNLSKLEAGEMELSPRRVDLAEEATEVAKFFEREADKAGIDFQVDLQAKPGRAQVHADVGGLRIVMRNLISNAIKYTKEGGQVLVRVKGAEGAAVLEVEDTGIGMDPEEVPKLFRAFKQGSEGPGREYEGTGLGLAVTKKVIDQMDGSIEVETEKGEGSRFTIRLPRVEEESKRRGR